LLKIPYKENFSIAPPTDDTGNPIEANDLNRIKQQALQQMQEIH